MSKKVNLSQLLFLLRAFGDNEKKFVFICFYMKCCVKLLLLRGKIVDPAVVFYWKKQERS